MLKRLGAELSEVLERMRKAGGTAFLVPGAGKAILIESRGVNLNGSRKTCFYSEAGYVSRPEDGLEVKIKISALRAASASGVR